VHHASYRFAAARGIGEELERVEKSWSV
jgi:hypothetical protein